MNRLCAALAALVVSAGCPWTVPAMADEPGYATPRISTRAAPAVKHRRVVKRSHGVREDFGYFGRGRSYGIYDRVTGEYQENQFPYYGRYYGNWPYRPRYSHYHPLPPASGVSVNTFKSGYYYGYSASRCHPPVSVRYVAPWGHAIDRQQYHCLE
jgi:hypothetical protein